MDMAVLKNPIELTEGVYLNTEVDEYEEYVIDNGEIVIEAHDSGAVVDRVSPENFEEGILIEIATYADTSPAGFLEDSFEKMLSDNSYFSVEEEESLRYAKDQVIGE